MYVVIACIFYMTRFAIPILSSEYYQTDSSSRGKTLPSHNLQAWIVTILLYFFENVNECTSYMFPIEDIQ